VIELIRSSSGSWTSESENMQPDFDAHGGLGFARGTDRGSKVLAVLVEGRFQSAFAGRPSPLLESDSDEDEDQGEDENGETSEEKAPVISGVVESSPASARLILIGSSTFLSDTAIGLATEATRNRYLKPLELIQNAVDWSLEDQSLLTLRGRGQFSRLLEPVGREGRVFWEALNYLLALAGLALVYWLYRRARIRRERADTDMLAGIPGTGGR
jgi:ABC-2 type transport system permease protein